MDKDLITYLDRRFDETGHQIESMFREMLDRFGEVSQRLDRGDERFERIDERFERIDERFERIDERFERIDERFERVETNIRHTHVLLEDLRRDLQGVAEGVVAGRETLDRFREEVDRRFTEQNATLRPYFAYLKRRDDELEARLSNVESVVASRGLLAG